MSEWQTIDTAPKDGTKVLCICMTAERGFKQFIGTMAVDEWNEKYRGFGKFNNNYWPATHWMPLPTPPKDAE